MVGELEGLAAARPARVAWAVPVLVLWLVFGLQILASLALNEGDLYFSLDDPYIHLALSEGIAQGHYGLNPSEVSAPSSSPLWPFLWAPFVGLGGVEWLVLLFNAACATWTLVLVVRILGLAFVPGADVRLHGALALFGILAIPAFNLVGLAFTGMEHSLQVLAAVGVVHELLRAVRTGATRPWLWFWVVLGPLVRYESASLSAAALLWAWWTGRRREAVLGGLGVALGLGAFSAFLLSQGLEVAPTSVLAKSVAAEADARPLLYGIYHNLASTPGVLMALAAVALVGAGASPDRPREERSLALAFAAGIALHVLVGRFGWYNRYELYAWTACWLVCAYLWREPIAHWLARQSLVVAALLGLAVVGVACRDYVIGLGTNAQATNNVFLQQAQLGRFAREHHRAPVAVNDLGLVSYRNEEYVLDLWGLSSLEALGTRTNSVDSAWVAPLAERFGVEVAMLYANWFPGLPQEWVHLGDLHMRGPRITPADDMVAFFATDVRYVDTLRKELAAWESELPDGASFVPRSPRD